MSDGPMPRYRELVAEGRIRADPAQRAAVEKLQILHMRLAGYDPSRRKKVALGWLGFGRKAARQDRFLTGLYIYGGVGRGKSMLMDLFFEGAPVNPKRRVHFHAFMQEVQVGLQIARESNVQDPLRPVADEVAEGATLLCFDEFQVTDIADAMILGRLFEALFARGVVIVATSNRPPDDLYENGLNRQLFLPFIQLLKENMDVHELEGGADHRQGREVEERRYFSPLGPGARAGMDAAWRREVNGEEIVPLTVSVRGRRVVIPQAADEVGRATFAELCDRPLGPADYLAVAGQFRVFFVDDVPRLGPAKHNQAKRLVTLIDAFYEARVKLYVSADAAPGAIFAQGEGAFEFARTASRLAEMQAAEWPGA
jgi:cell division protein ZapE